MKVIIKHIFFTYVFCVIIQPVESILCGEGTYADTSGLICKHCPAGSRSPPGSRQLADCECGYDKTWVDIAACCHIMKQITVSSLHDTTGVSLNAPSICREPLRQSSLVFYTDISVDVQSSDPYEFILQYGTMNSQLAVIHILFGNNQSITLNIMEISGNTHGPTQTSIKFTKIDALNIFTREIQHNAKNLGSTVIEFEESSLRRFSIIGDNVVLYTAKIKSLHKILSFWDFRNAGRSCEKCPKSSNKKNLYECETCNTGVRVTIQPDSKWWESDSESIQIYRPDWATDNGGILRYSSIDTSANLILTAASTHKNDNVKHVCQNTQFDENIYIQTLIPAIRPLTTTSFITTPRPPITTQTTTQTTKTTQTTTAPQKTTQTTTAPPKTTAPQKTTAPRTTTAQRTTTTPQKTTASQTTTAQRTTTAPRPTTTPAPRPIQSCVLNPTCGDGIMEFIEGCDDGNVDSGDGCDGKCLLEDMWVCILSNCSLSKCLLKKPHSIEATRQVIFSRAASVELKSMKAKLVIRVGTVYNETTFSIDVSEQTTCSQLYFDKFKNIGMISKCFTFGPEEITFSKPITIIIRAGEIETSSRPETHSIRRYDPARREWISYPTVVKNDSHGISYQVETSHFSTYAVFQNEAKEVIDPRILIVIFVGIFMLFFFVCIYRFGQAPKGRTIGATYSPVEDLPTCEYCQNRIQ